MTTPKNNFTDERANHGVRGVTILGSTGSIGINTLDVLARHPDRYRIMALTANTQVERLFEQCQKYLPPKAVMLDPHSAIRLKEKVRKSGIAVEVLSGIEGLNTVATHLRTHIVVAAIVGAAGLMPTLAAVRAKKRVLLANKEPLVMSGHIFINEARASGAELIPVDSEHNAIFQCMPIGYTTGAAPATVKRIFLTCSGGPFRTFPAEALVSVTPEQACAHPKWVMGPKISVDSATLMNKGLELIEACWLFGVTPDQVEIVIHPQSVVHSMVEYVDGSVLAQLSNPDMRTPIAHALAWPERIESGVKSLDPFELARLDFERPDLNRFPCLRLAYEAARAGGTTPAILNAANEVAVQAFLDRRIGFTDIPRVIEYTLKNLPANRDNQLGTVLSDDVHAREMAGRYVTERLSHMSQGVT
ncbi:MAG: 1-deoxy-D-xylulose-5-phosphate reductoisomerase [Sulfuricaulis sp.]|uniref:1-deoxy-D-xylulose-5-phosphate reductoisomerase n=1 Tax=Sulfuricaulis sp. TaxID=2003553 RepID=UPI0034A2BF74